ncbi:PAS domain S-box protein [Pseudohoeflea suaedae]|uniref:histidine kinase n=1 Tax=Pseudohoeflea suaedae TaxID=877384 RepID=A0A4R5PME6_9HYPH|nr:PAS domain S-box protein [Pseudohoeflea suaedae]TDH38123.1 PAS domain S-box protein [Pseudohoeflea suaedae]
MLGKPAREKAPVARSGLLVVAILATVYLTAGAVGLQMAVPPGYATVLWPASGLALAILLLHGVRHWPGILIGSFILNSLVGGIYRDGAIDLVAMAAAAGIAAGSSLQAVLAFKLIERLYGIPIRIGGYSDLIRIAVICGPVVCTVAATVGVTTLWLAGAVDGPSYLKNWLNWWAGDTLGVILFLPIGLLNPWRPWTVEWEDRAVTGFTIATLAMLAIPLLGTVMAWNVASRVTFEHSSENFSALANNNLQALDSRMNAYKRALDGGAGFFDASDRITAPEWRSYVETLTIRDSLPGISGIGFIEPVDETKLDIYPRLVMADGVADLEIHPDGERFDNFIIKYIEPVAPNRKAVGLNIGFEKNRHEAAVHARDTGLPTITRRILLVQDETESAGFLLLRPIYYGDPDFLKTASARQAAFRGWIYAPFIAPRFMNGLTLGQGQLFNVRIYDGSSTAEDDLIYASGASRPAAHFKLNIEVPVMEQTWTIVWESTPKFESAVTSKLPLITLVAGLALSVMFAALLLAFTRREETVRSIVQTKTRELSASEQRTRSLIDTAMVGIMLLDEERNILSANRAAEHIFARSDKRLVGTPLSKVIGGDLKFDLGGHANALRRTRSGEGVDLYIELQINPWKDMDGASRYTALIRDVTSEEVAKQALTENERRWNAALEGSEIGVFDIDLTTGISVVSKTWKLMLGFSADEEIDAQSEWQSRIHPDDRPTVEAADRACIEGSSQRSVSEYRIRRVDGDWIWLRSDTEVTERSDDGTALRMIGTQTNITELRKTMDALQRSEERFRTAIHNAPVGMAMASLDRRWMEVNQALCHLLGYRPDELIGKDARDFIHVEDIDPDDARPRQLADGAINSYQREMRMLHKNGRLVWVLVSVSMASDLETGSRYFITQFQDLTEIKEAEQLKTEFVATVSHELRTPLTSIRGSLGLVLGAMKEDLPANVTRLLSIAHSNCERLVLLINDILDLEKISNGKMRFDKRKESIADIVQQAFEANQGYADAHEVIQELAMPLPKTIVNVDLARLHQVFANLLSNAAKFSPAGSTVRVSAQAIDGGVKVMIADQGPGIPPEFRDKIFSRFSQADGSATRAKGGTGLGLHISKQIVEQMDGEIGFDATPGEGSTFWITLPAVDTEESSLAAAATEGDLPAILHVEDDRDFSEVVAAYLRDRARVICSATIPEARSLLAGGTIDMVIIDIGLYNGNGLELLGQVSEMGLPIIVLTAQEDYDPDIRVDAYLPKSRVTEARVVETVVGLLQERAQVQREAARGRS